MVTRGRPSWFKPDTGLAMRMVLTMFLLGAVYVIFGGVLWGLGFPLPVILLFAVVIAGVQFFFADKIALGSMGAQMVTEQQAPELYAMVSRLCAQANLPTPRIAIIQSQIPNAFATGRDREHAVVAVTTGIMNQLSQPQLEAVIAHELTHIINRDMLVMTIASFFAMVAALLTRSLMWGSMFGGYGYGGGRRSRDGENTVVIAMLASVIVYVISFILIRALSRYRELAADRGSALITGAPENLASALLTISGNIERGAESRRIPEQDFRKAGVANALFIVPAIKGESIQTLFSTHPSIQDRVKRLQAMQQQMEQAHNS